MRGALALIVLTLLLHMITINLDTTINATAIPHISDEFHAIDEDGCTFLRTTTSFQSTRGKGFQYLPLKPTLLVTMFIFKLSSLV